jgi:hypothetical protein
MQPSIPIFGIRGIRTGQKEDQQEEGASTLISTVAENRKGYTLRQFERAKEARRLYYIVGTPTASHCFG